MGYKNSVCYKCDERSIDCHGTCKKYLEEVEENQKGYGAKFPDRKIWAKKCPVAGVGFRRCGW